MTKSHQEYAEIVLRAGLALSLLWSVSTKLTTPEMVQGLFNSLGFGFVTPGMVVVIGIGLLVVSLLLLAGKYLKVVGSLLAVYFLGSMISGAFAGDAVFSVGPAIWKDFAFLGIAGYFALGGHVTSHSSSHKEDAHPESAH